MGSHEFARPKGLTIGSPVFAQHTRVTNTRTDTHGPRYRYICNNRPHPILVVPRPSLALLAFVCLERFLKHTVRNYFLLDHPADELWHSHIIVV